MSDILLVCAEESSSRYGIQIIQQLQQRLEANIFGIGDSKMEQAGMKRFGKSEDMAIMGIVEVIKHYKSIKKVYNDILNHVDATSTKVAVLLDYPGFNLRLAKDLKKRGVYVIYFISPSVWAWKKGRIKTIKKYVDEMLVIFPFEESFYKKEGVNARYVGNPLMNTLDMSLLKKEQIQYKRQKMGYNEGDIILGLMPGSRRSEIEQHLNIQIATYLKLKQQNPKIKANILLSQSIDRDYIQKQLPIEAEDIVIVKDEPNLMLQALDYVLVASGTATLVAGLMLKPMLVMYRVNPITAWIARRLVHIPWVSLVNILSQKEVVPERIQEEVKVDILVKDMSSIMETERTKQIVQDLKHLHEILGKQNPIENVVERVLVNV